MSSGFILLWWKWKCSESSYSVSSWNLLPSRFYFSRCTSNMLSWVQLPYRIGLSDSVYSHACNRLYMGKSSCGLYHQEMSSWFLLSECNHTNSMCIWKILSRGLDSRIGVPYRFLLFDTGDERDMFDDGMCQRYMEVSRLFIDFGPRLFKLPLTVCLCWG